MALWQDSFFIVLIIYLIIHIIIIIWTVLIINGEDIESHIAPNGLRAPVIGV